MNAALRIFTWLLALALVALPVVAVVNGWIGADRWPLTKLRVHGQFERVDPAQLQAVVLPYAKLLCGAPAGRAGRRGKTAVGRTCRSAQALAGRDGNRGRRTQAVRTLGR